MITSLRGGGVSCYRFDGGPSLRPVARVLQRVRHQRCYRFDGGPSLRLGAALRRGRHRGRCYRFDGGPSLRLGQIGACDSGALLLPFRRWHFIEAATPPAARTATACCYRFDGGPSLRRQHLDVQPQRHRPLLPFRRGPFSEVGRRPCASARGWWLLPFRLWPFIEASRRWGTTSTAPGCYRFGGGPSLRRRWRHRPPRRRRKLLPFRRWPFIEAARVRASWPRRGWLLPFRQWPLPRCAHTSNADFSGLDRHPSALSMTNKRAPVTRRAPHRLNQRLSVPRPRSLPSGRRQHGQLQRVGGDLAF